MTTRREALKQSAVVAGLLCASGLFPQFAAAAYNKNAFSAKSLAEAFKALGVAAPVASTGVTVQAADIAENGAVVPIGVTVALAGVKQILLLIEKNPVVLIAQFNLSDSVDTALNTRVKMAQTSDVYAVAVMNDGKLLYGKKEVKVTLGGCGG